MSKCDMPSKKGDHKSNEILNFGHNIFRELYFYKLNW